MGVIAVVAAVVYPPLWIRRAWRVLADTGDRYDSDGYKIYRDRRGYHYKSVRLREPVYPLADGWPQRYHRVHREPLWCVTAVANDARPGGVIRPAFCRRDGTAFKSLPRSLRGYDPALALRRMEREARGKWDDLHGAPRTFEAQADAGFERHECPDCGRLSVDADTLSQHRHDKHRVTALAA